MKNTFLLVWIIILLGVNFKVYKDVKNTNKTVKTYSFISIILGIAFIIMFGLFNIF